MPHGGGHHGGGGGGSRAGGFTYLVDNSDWATQPVDLQPAGNTINVLCPSSNPFEDGCDVHVQTQLSGGLAGPDPHQVSRRIVTRPRQLPAVHAGRAAVHQYQAAAVRRGFLPGLGAAPAGKPKPKATPATQTVLVVTPAAEPSWWESMVGGPVGALQAQALPRAPTVRRVTIPVAKPAVKAKGKPKAPPTAAMPAGASPVSGWGMGDDVPLPADDSGGDSSDGGGVDFTVGPSAGAGNVILNPVIPESGAGVPNSAGPGMMIPAGTVIDPATNFAYPPGTLFTTPAMQQYAQSTPIQQQSGPLAPGVAVVPNSTATPFANSQYTPPPLAPQPYLGPGSAQTPIAPSGSPTAKSTSPSLFSQISNSITTLAPTVAPVLAATYKLQAAKAAAKTAQAQATQQSLLQQAAAAATKSSNLPIILVGGGALLLTVVLLMRRS